MEFGPIRLSVQGGADYLNLDWYYRDFAVRAESTADTFSSIIASKGFTPQTPEIFWKEGQEPDGAAWMQGFLSELGVMASDHVCLGLRVVVIPHFYRLLFIRVPTVESISGIGYLSSDISEEYFMLGGSYEDGNDGKGGLSWHVGGYGGFATVNVIEEFEYTIEDGTANSNYMKTMSRATGIIPVAEVFGGADYWFFKWMALTCNAGYRRAVITSLKYSNVDNTNLITPAGAEVGDKLTLPKMDVGGVFIKAGLRFIIGSPRRPKPETQEIVARKIVKRTGEKMNIAVANLEPQSVSAADAAVISDRLRSEMVKTGAFNVVEKQNMEKILAEHAFQQSGCTSQECAVKLGRILNVKKMVVGSFGQLMNKHFISVRVVDVETGSADFSEDASGANVDEIMAGTRKIAESMANNLVGE